MKKLILFGAGHNGKEALIRYGVEKVAFFADNSKEKQREGCMGLQVLSFEEMIDKYQAQKYIIMVTPDNCLLRGQLEQAGIFDYLVYHKLTVDNIFLNNEANNAYYEHNKLIDKFVAQSNEIDLLRDWRMFREVAKVVERAHSVDNLSLSKYTQCGEGEFYGNLKVLRNYAGANDIDEIYSPIIAHNNIKALFSTCFAYKKAVVFSGEYYQKEIHERFPYVPVFSVGPYLQYAKGIYSDSTVDILKKRNGKTLTVFMPHSIEDCPRLYSKKQFIDDVLDRFGSKFNTLYLCVYWADITDAACEYAENNGFKVVTSGFRFDSNFDSRLKTILDLSDAVLGGDYGTFYTYALAAGIPVARIDISNNSTINDVEFKTELEKKVQYVTCNRSDEVLFYKTFTEDFNCSAERKKWINPYCGFNIKRSPEYMRAIFEISRDILLNCEGNMLKYRHAVYDTYNNYDLQADIFKMKVLKDAVGNFIE